MKRILSFLLAFSLFAISFSSLPAVAVSITPTADWGEVNSDGDYTIASAEDLVAFMKSIESGTDYLGKTVKLTANITINQGDASQWTNSTSGLYNWTDCMNTSNFFKGTFDGQGYTISGLYCYSTKNNVGHGLFGKVSGATIQNLTLENSYISGGRYVSAIAGIVQTGLTTIQNCKLDGISLHCSGANANSGGLIGVCNSAGGFLISDCTVTDSKLVNGRYWGGLVGQAGSLASNTTANQITGCIVTDTVSISGTQDIGGLIGINQAAVVLSNDTVKATLMGENNIGGLVGSSSGTLSIDRPVVDSVVDASGIQVGEIVGYSSAAITLSDGSVSGTLKAGGAKSIGGLIGKAVAAVTVKDLKVSDLTVEHTNATSQTAADAGVGGLIGNHDGAALLIDGAEITNLTVTGNVVYVGGLVALTDDGGTTATIQNVTAVNLVVNSRYSGAVMGGIVAQARGDVSLANILVYESLHDARILGGLVGNLASGQNLKAEKATVLGTLSGNYLVGGVIANAGSGSAHTLECTDVAVNTSLNGAIVAGISANQYEGNTVQLNNVVVAGSLNASDAVADLLAHSSTVNKNITDTYRNVYTVRNGQTDYAYAVPVNGGTSVEMDTAEWKSFAFAGWNRMTDSSLPLPATAEALALYKAWLLTCDPQSAVETDVSLRLDEDGYQYSGIRFGTRLNKDLYDAMVSENVEITVGTLVIPTDLLNGAPLTLDTENAANIVNRGWYNDTAEKYFAVLRYEYYGSVIDLKQSNRDRSFSAVGYWTVGDKTYYGTVVTGNALELAEAYLFSQDFYSNQELAVLLKYTKDDYGLEQLGDISASYVYGNGARMVSYSNKSNSDFAAYCTYLEEILGYTLYDKTTIDSLTSATYQKGDAMIHVTFVGSVLNVVFSDTGANHLPSEYPALAAGTYAISVIQLQESDHDNGMGYLIQLSDGSFLIYDGGYADTVGTTLSNGFTCAENQAEQLYTLMRNLVHSGDPIVIRAWVLTHAHNDHTLAFADFANHYASKVTLHQVIISPVNACEADLSTYLRNGILTDIAAFTDAKIAYAYTGMSLTFGDLTMDILLTGGDVYISRDANAIANGNNSSLVSRLYNGDNSMLFLGDLGSQGANLLASYYSSALKCNMLQVAHHGGADVYEAFYRNCCDSDHADILWYDSSLVYFTYGDHDNKGNGGGGEYDTRKHMTAGRTEGEGYLLHNYQYRVDWTTGKITKNVYSPEA